MPERHASRGTSLVVPDDQPLIGIIVPENGQEMTHYFIDEETADEALAQRRLQTALNVIGAWSDLDWDEAIAELDRIRHESTPTPPIDDL